MIVLSHLESPLRRTSERNFSWAATCTYAVAGGLKDALETVCCYIAASVLKNTAEGVMV